LFVTHQYRSAAFAGTTAAKTMMAPLTFVNYQCWIYNRIAHSTMIDSNVMVTMTFQWWVCPTACFCAVSDCRVFELSSSLALALVFVCLSNGGSVMLPAMHHYKSWFENMRSVLVAAASACTVLKMVECWNDAFLLFLFLFSNGGSVESRPLLLWKMLHRRHSDWLYMTIFLASWLSNSFFVSCRLGEWLKECKSRFLSNLKLANPFYYIHEFIVVLYLLSNGLEQCTLSS
jgi:hypothetical protein